MSPQGHCVRHSVRVGVLKDFLRELPSPLIPPGLYRAVLGTMGTSGTLGTTGSHREATTLLDGLPEPEKVGTEMGFTAPKMGSLDPKMGFTAPKIRG